MAALPPLYVILDGASAMLTLAVAAGFLSIAHWSRQGLHYLVAAGFTLLATGFLFVSVSHFGSPVDADAADAVRIVCQLTGSLLLLFAYGSVHLTGKSHAFAVAAASVGGVVGVGLFLHAADLLGAGLPSLQWYFAVAYSLMSMAYLGCALLSGYGWHKRPTWGRAMVPLGFFGWTLSTYTWIFIVLAGTGQFLPVVYTWRFLAILLMLWAMVRRPRSPSRRFPDAPA